MPKARKGPGGPRRSAGGAPGTNKSNPMGGAKGSGKTRGLTPRTKGRYGRRRGY